jgi:hypothetical protein
MLEQRNKTLSPQEVRNILKADNKEIVELCKSASIMPRKNRQGQTYFSYDEVKHLRRVQAEQSANYPVTRPIQAKQPAMMASILNSINSLEKKLSAELGKVIDEKLEGMDEVVVELIRCKTDNETLRQKVVDLNKEIYQLKNDVSAFKPVCLGLYKKKERNMWEQT